MELKPGIKTTEFWLTLLSQVLGFLVLFGVISAEEAQSLEQVIAAVIVAAGGLAAVIIPLVAYIKGRVELKS